MLYGLLNLSFWGYVAATLMLTHITILGVTIFLHRTQAHRGLDLHPVVSHFFRLWLWLTTGMVTKEWVAVHRKHHARCEVEDDPHSPQIEGIRKVLWQGAELYRKEAQNQHTLDKYGKGTPNDWLECKIYNPLSSKGILIMLIIDLLMFGVPGVTIWAIQMMWIPFFAAGVINGIGHFWGYRNFEAPDASRNIVPWGILIGGEELHNNHHAFGTSAKFSIKWWELDVGWVYISLMRLFGLAKVKRLPPPLHLIEGKSQIDLDTVKAIVLNRMRVLAHYSREVILPTFHQAQKQVSQQGRQLLFRAKKCLLREESLLDDDAKACVKAALDVREDLKLVYEYRGKLKAIWAKTSTTQKELIEAFQTWCQEAEESGIQSLKDFAIRLKGYSLGA